MRSRVTKPKLVATATLAAIALVSVGCGSSTKKSAATATSTGGATGSTGGPATGKYASGKTIILDTLYRAPLAQNQQAGAAQAASEAGAKLAWVGPPSPDPSTAIKDLQDAVAAGGDGAIVAAFPGDLFRTPIDQTGLPVVTIDIYSPGSKAATHFGPNKYQMGVALAKEFAKALPANATGTIVGGICVAGLPSLTAPQQGFIDTMKQLQPGVTVNGNVPVNVDPTKNFADWQRIIQQTPAALGFVGQCDQDAPNLIKLKQDSGAKWIIGDTSGDNPQNIAAVKAGTMVALVSQNGWPEGYLSGRLLLEHIANKTTLPTGWIDTGFTLVTKDNADAVTARLNDPSMNATVFKDLVDKVLANPQAATQPYSACVGCGVK